VDPKPAPQAGSSVRGRVTACEKDVPDPPARAVEEKRRQDGGGTILIFLDFSGLHPRVASCHLCDESAKEGSNVTAWDFGPTGEIALHSVNDERATSRSSDSAASRLHELLGYVEQVVKLDERPAFKLAEYRLPNGQTYQFHQHEFHAMPGVKHDQIDDDGPIWLTMERLKRHNPPKVPEELVAWLDASPDPERTPALREFLLNTVPARERDALVAEGKARAEDCQPALGPEGKGKFDVRIRIEDHPEISEAADRYLSGPWLSWANEERPRRRSIALYQKLFEAAQLAELGGPEQAIELVWGIGLSRWRKDVVLIDLPLLERLVEIEIDERAGGLIRVRPRLADATVNLRPYEELKLDGIPLALNAARRALAISAEDGEGVSPFLRDTFEPILRVCQSQIDAEGRYLTDSDPLEPSSDIPPASLQLIVSDRWVLFARKRNDNFLLKDIENLQKSVEDSKEELPGPARTLVMGPERETDITWKPLSGTMGGSTEPPEPDEQVSLVGDLFFPKPYNAEQVEILRRLEKTDGVVVQGPPGTGKTHTISNIICHYLATGRRVLVVSHGEAALAVLRDKLPEEVRDLAISITTSEREGLKQLEGAIRLLQSIVQTLRPGEQSRLIKDTERSIIGMRQRIAAIDAEIESTARAQLSEVQGRGVLPAQLAKAVVALRASCGWFSDRPTRFLSESGLTTADLDRLRRARLALGKRIQYLNTVLPSVSDLPTGAVLAQLHADILSADVHAARAASDTTFVPRITSSQAIAAAERAAQLLDTLIEATHHFEAFPWLRPFALAGVPHQHLSLTPALEGLITDAVSFLEEYKHYVQHPVALPTGAASSPEFAAIVTKLARGQNAFGLFAFSEKKLKHLIDAVQIVGRKPQNPDEWRHVGAYIKWSKRFSEIGVRWNAIARDLGQDTGQPLTLRQLASLTVALRVVFVLVPPALRELDECLRPTLAKAPGALWPDASRMAMVRDCLRDAAAATRLSAARAEVSRVKTLFTNEAGKVGTLAKNFLTDGVGCAEITTDRIKAAWEAVLATLDDVVQHRESFEAVRDIAARIEGAGARQWADRLRRTPALDGSDPVIPVNWADAWDWAASEHYLGRIDRREAMHALAEERAALDTSVAKALERLVRERTFYALAQSMTGPVRAALMMFATALRRIGTGKSVGAARHRRAARQAMADCYGGVPCWIMPSWRVAEQLPGEVGTFDLVIMDEASQSDIKEVTTLLRGKKVLVVGDDKQVSPMAAFIENAKIDRLERTYLAKQPFKTLLLPGASLYDLAKVMFPDKFVMLREHFRCVEPIIQFSTQFYTEDLIPLRIPTTQERLDPPLVDIYVPDGRRSGDKINHREAEVIIEEIRQIVENPALAKMPGTDVWRSIGVISLIGSKQAALINRMVLDALGEEAVMRHRIACGDSATFQGNERDIILLSMVADPSKKQAQTATHFEQRFNVAMSRARDRLYLIRSVREEELNPKDLKANVIRHIREPMKGRTQPSVDLLALCDSDFEREILGKILERGYRVAPQVGAMGYSIDMVVEGTGNQRLAVECDGDKYHGPERWADDMVRQRVLERVGWRFWRCWSSSYTIDPDGCVADLFATLTRMGIYPAQGETRADSYTEHRVAKASAAGARDAADLPFKSVTRSGIQVGDSVIVRYLDDNKTMSFVLSDEGDDPVNGIVSARSPLGSQLVGCNEEDEVEFEANGVVRRVLVVRVERAPARPH
jgi:very-short-patch-repair endonuclease